MKRRPTHPGVVLLEDVIRPLNLTITDAAKMLGVSRKALSEFVNEKAMLSPEMAIRIATATHTSPGSGAASSEECYPVSICGIRRSRSIADVMIMKSSEQ